MTAWQRLRTAEATVISHRQAARELARDGGDDAAISAAESKMRDAQDRSATHSGAIVDVDKTIAELSAEIERIIDKRMRAETNLALAAMVTRVEKARLAFDEG